MIISVCCILKGTVQKDSITLCSIYQLKLSIYKYKKIDKKENNGGGKNFKPTSKQCFLHMLLSLRGGSGVLILDFMCCTQPGYLHSLDEL